jgi:hypothetical protein
MLKKQRGCMGGINLTWDGDRVAIKGEQCGNSASSHCRVRLHIADSVVMYATFCMSFWGPLVLSARRSVGITATCYGSWLRHRFPVSRRLYRSKGGTEPPPQQTVEAHECTTIIGLWDARRCLTNDDRPTSRCDIVTTFRQGPLDIYIAIFRWGLVRGIFSRHSLISNQTVVHPLS